MLEHEELPHVWCFLPWQQKPHCKPSFCLLHFSHLKKTLAAETTVRVPAGSRRLCCGGLLQSTGDTTLQLKNSWVGVTLPPLGINKNKGISDSNCACATRLFALLVPKSSVFITHIHTQLPVCPPNHNSPTIFFFFCIQLLTRQSADSLGVPQTAANKFKTRSSQDDPPNLKRQASWT